MVAIQGNTRIVDVTGMAVAMGSATNDDEGVADEGNEASAETNNKKKRKLDSDEKPSAAPVDNTPVSLPKGLSQLEIRVPTDEKDTMTYLFLLKV